MVNKLVVGIVVVVLLVLSGFFLFLDKLTEKEPDITTSADYCIQDSDCVAKEACHPKNCVNKAHVENEKIFICSAVCEPGSLDCDQGYCSCLNNKCNAVFK
jgi:hypothetical protein